ncbi:uncharacterized protein LOC126323023 isoform X2 [Schistocerca gregaria]|uniref:uncharacterized protein LOC126323023 isoform X2 n=1 Tax=Schistocerca gregaria TaxID=7010 RepID=UPI00211E744B|nr:uncharacterized protein LOC126323023 isoform X2 [Schistocerca gregaria]
MITKTALVQLQDTSGTRACHACSSDAAALVIRPLLTRAEGHFMSCATSHGVQCAVTYNTRSFWVLAMSVRPRRCACLSASWTCVVVLALCSAALGRIDGNENGRRLCTDPGCVDGVDPSYQDEVTRIRRTIDDNEISQDTNEFHWKPGDLGILSDKLSVYKDSEGDYKAVEDVKFESDNADGALESTYAVDLQPQESKSVGNEQKIVYSYPYVVFRRIGDGRKVVGNEDAIYKDGTSYVLFGNSDEHTEHHGGFEPENVHSHSASDKTGNGEMFHDILNDFLKTITSINLTPHEESTPTITSINLTPHEESTPDKRNEMSNAVKVALEIIKELFTNSDEMQENVDSVPRESINTGTFLNGLYRDYTSPFGGYWSPWGWQSASEPSGDVSIIDRLLASMVSGMLEDAAPRKTSRTSSVSTWCPFMEIRRLPEAQPSEGLVPAELMWLIAMTESLPLETQTLR